MGQKKIGILAIQGDFEAHAKTLDRLGSEHRYVRRPEDLAQLNGVILPGGESTTHLKVMTEEGLFEALKKFAADGGAFFGTCAGAILLCGAGSARAEANNRWGFLISRFCAMATGVSLPAMYIQERRNCAKNLSKWFSSGRPLLSPWGGELKCLRRMRAILC